MQGDIMTQDEKDYICSIIDNGGFKYAFINYSNFSEIEDEKLHELIDKYKDAACELENYVGYSV